MQNNEQRGVAGMSALHRAAWRAQEIPVPIFTTGIHIHDTYSNAGSLRTDCMC